MNPINYADYKTVQDPVPLDHSGHICPGTFFKAPSSEEMIRRDQLPARTIEIGCDGLSNFLNRVNSTKRPWSITNTFIRCGILDRILVKVKQEGKSFNFLLRDDNYRSMVRFNCMRKTKA